MNQEELNQEWRILATPWISRTRHSKNSNRTGLLDIWMLKLCGDVKNLTILDCGCGEGRFCRMLDTLGTKKVIGLDLCEPLIEAANQWKGKNDSYLIGNAENLVQFEDETFDIVISYLNQCDLPNFKKNNQEVFRVLKAGGKFIIANLHPMRSAKEGWCKNHEGAKMHVHLDNYFDEDKRKWKMLGVDFTNFHRTISTYINSYLSAGFQLKQIIEPTVSQETLIEHPDLEDELRVPNFIIYELQK